MKLTEAQFLALADRTPLVDNCGDLYYYRVELIESGEGAHTYPSFEIGPTQIVDFPTFESAHNYIKIHSTEQHLYCSRITAYRLFESAGLRCAQWLYDGRANLVDCTIVQKTGTAEETLFFGRPIAKQRFRSGQIAELIQVNEVKLALVLQPVPTPERCWKLYSDSPSSYALDYRADSYGVLFVDSGELAQAIPTTLMAPRYPIPKEVAAQFNPPRYKYIDIDDNFYIQNDIVKVKSGIPPVLETHSSIDGIWDKVKKIINKVKEHDEIAENSEIHQKEN